MAVGVSVSVRVGVRVGVRVLRELVNFDQGITCRAISSAYDGGICSCGQMKHECRVERVWRGESILRGKDNVVGIALPVVVARNNRSFRVVDC